MNNHTEIVCIIDESGSMQHQQQATIDGFNKFLADQRAAPGTANVTLVTFSNGWRTPIKSTSVNLVPNLDKTTYRPDGGTALLDAVGNAIKTLGDVAEGVPGSDVVFVIITDGGENASTDYKREQVKEMIVAREAKGWKFIFLGANQDAFAEAGGLGINQMTASNYVATATGTAGSYGYSSDVITTMRSAKAAGMSVEGAAFNAIAENMKKKWEKELEGKTDADSNK